MIEIYVYYSRCNNLITNAMLDIIEKNPESYSYKTKGYYDSISSVINHLYISSLHWLNDFSVVINTNIKKEIAEIKLPEYGSFPLLNIKDARLELLKTTHMSEILCNEIEESDLSKVMTKKRKNGQIIEKGVWKALIHFFNHQTHHRGQVSEVLDEMKIENDYSNMIFIE